MQYLKVDNLSKRYGEKLLFENLSFVINKDEKVALLAANGTGKSSMIKALCGIETADSGDINFHKDIRVDFLMQEPNLTDDLSILENILFSDNPATKAISGSMQIPLSITKDSSDTSMLIEACIL